MFTKFEVFFFVYVFEQLSVFFFLSFFFAFIYYLQSPSLFIYL